MSAKLCSRWLHYFRHKPLRRFFRNPRRILWGYVKRGMTVLDVGCGTGFFSLAMARMAGPDGRVIGVDLQADVLESLKQRSVRAELSERIDTRVCSEGSLEIDDLGGRVDFALAYYVVHHAPNVPALMADVHRALKAGGMFLVVEPGHHASADECHATEAAAQEAGFAIVEHPKLTRDWAVMLVKN
ncbi:MAG: class I SAM-dependent methyltransferase [candidate division Zixibacteria bacterium]|nr:class I SAM-dependent methyltransferase [candidate division Zixibacteria bacterium]